MMRLADYLLKRKIICMTRGTKLKLSPSRWHGIISNAVNASAKTIKNGRVKTTSRTTLAPWGEICIHDYKWDLKKRLISPFRPPRAGKAWKHSLSLMQSNFPIIEPLLYLELKNGPFVSRSFTVTRWIESTPLSKTAKERHLISDTFFLGLLQKSTELIAELHSKGFVHQDLKFGNFLWVPAKQVRVILSDLDHLEKTVAAQKQGKDLARFILSALEYDMGWEVAESLITCYFNSRRVCPAGLEKSLITYIERKKSRYENRHLAKIGGPQSDATLSTKK